MTFAVWTHPEDLRDEGPERALEVIAAAGIGEVRLAVSYHRAEVVTPRSRHRRLLRTRDGVHFRPDASRYGRLRPLVAYGGAPQAPGHLAAIRERGLRATAWVVIANNTALGEQQPDAVVRNAWGDHLPFALCVANPAVREYATALVADVAAQLDVAEICLEAWHHRRFVHSMARQLSVVPPESRAAQEMSWCFCPACVRRAQDAGIDADRLADRIRVGAVDAAAETQLARVREEIVSSLAAELSTAAGEVPVRFFVPDPELAATDGVDLAGLAGAGARFTVGCYGRTAAEVEGAAARARRLVGAAAPLELALRPRDPYEGDPLPILVGSAERGGDPEDVSFYQYGQLTGEALAAIGSLTRRPVR